MPGFTIACILGGTNSSTTTAKNSHLKRKTSHDDDDDYNEHQPNKRQTIEGNTTHLPISLSHPIRTRSMYFQQRIRLN